MIKTGMNKKWTGILYGICTLLAALFCFLTAGVKPTPAKAENENATATQIDRVEVLNGSFMLYLTQADYMTAEEWDTTSNEAYKWVASLDWADRKNHNVHNALLNKNLDKYNYGDYILVDDEAIEADQITLHANRFTRVNTLGIDFAPTVLANMQKITFKAGCQLPTLTYSYFGEGEFSCLTLEEDYIFKNHNGVWVRAYPFEGYEEGKLYDADEKSFYTREETSSFKGHKEAPMSHFETAFSDNGWMGEKGYVLSSAIAEKGDLVVLEFVNPINAEEFAAIELNVFSNVPRSLAVHNAYDVTSSSLGDPLQTFTLPGRSAISFTTVTLISAYYADENGMIDTLVFRVLDDGSATNRGDNCIYVGAFVCNRLNVVYSNSFLIEEGEDAYHLTYRFNAKGEFTGKESLPLSKVFVNGESIEAINRKGQFATAKWAAVQGVYQIDVTLLKAYEGTAAIKNADNNFAGNSMQVAKGLVLPNGEMIDRDYACRIYAGETFVDYEMLDSYEDTRVTSVHVGLDYNPNAPENDPNIHFRIIFDEKITQRTYVHAAQTEAWRVVALTPYVGYYDEEISSAFVAGGFKASLFDNVFINGKSVGDWQASDAIPTAVLAHYGQTGLYTLDLSIDCLSDMYDDIYAAFNSGEDITIEIKSGMKFATAVKTTQDFKCVINGYSVTMGDEKPEMQVFYDGKKVEEGDLLRSATPASENNISVQGIAEYSVQKTVNGNTTTFVISYGENKSFIFAVKENIINEIPTEKEGCSSSVSLGGVAILLAIATIVLSVRRKHYE